MKGLGGIRAVTLDVGGTLIDPWPSVGHVYAEVAARHGVRKLSPTLLNRRFGAAWQRRTRLVQTEAAWAEVVDEVFSGLTARPPRQTFFPELYQRFCEPGAWRVYEDVHPTLRALAARGVRLGVVSNWDERLRPLLGRLDLADYFQSIVVSCEAGYAKPSKAIFELAAQKLETPAAAALHVGDDAELDLQGAGLAGLQALQICRGAAADRGGQIKSLRELVPILRS